MANEARTSPHYSRMPGTARASATKAPQATRTQRLLERILFALFGGMLALGGFALYATSTAAHNAVPERVAAGLDADRVNVLVMTTETRSRLGMEVEATTALGILSMQPSSGTSTFIGVPLHLWAELGAYGNRPIGAAFEVGNAAGTPGAGAGLTIDAVERATGVPVHAFARFSTAALADSIRAGRGITVHVDRGVYDARHRERFARGSQLLDARRALVYAFSPYMVGFAATAAETERRRQAVIAASLPQLLRSAAAGGEGVDTNLSAAQIGALRDITRKSASTVVSLAPHLIPVQKTTAVYAGEAWIPRGGQASLRQAAAAALINTR